MIFHLSSVIKQYISGANVLHYVSFRAMAALLTSLVFSFMFGSFFIKLSQKLFRSSARPFTPESHQETKNDMPTMGGLFIIAVVCASVLLWTDLSDSLVWTSLWCLISFGAIGLLDDLNKIWYKKGISGSLKFCLQVIASLGVLLLWSYDPYFSTALSVPFFKDLLVALGFLFIPWVILVLSGTSNAVNLTDGLDGLAISGLLANFATFSVVSYLAGHAVLSAYLQIPFAGTAELSVVGAALFGASLGFLWYNTYPAQIIMGDVGALSLGAVLAFMALACKQEFLLVLAGGLFVVETVSVIAQVLGYKLWKKRIFKMAPLHHHFELLGWQESKITVRFSIISFVLCLLALMTLKIR